MGSSFENSQLHISVSFPLGAGRSITSICNYGAKEDGERKLLSRLSKTIQIVINVLR